MFELHRIYGYMVSLFYQKVKVYYAYDDLTTCIMLMMTLQLVLRLIGCIHTAANNSYSSSRYDTALCILILFFFCFC